MNLPKDKRHGVRSGGKWSRAYYAWQNMKGRILRPKQRDGQNYVKNGIQICDRWMNSFSAFLEDMGDPPEGMVLDRVNNLGNYCKENCKWSTHTESSRNTGRVKLCMEIALKIRALYEISPLSQMKIARIFKIDQTTVS